MKKLLGILAVAGLMAACNTGNDENDGADSAKEVIDSSADAKIEQIDSTRDAKIENIDSAKDHKDDDHK